jgi:hypothetical protein
VKKFRFIFTVSKTFEVTLDENQIYPDYPWHLAPEHAKDRKGAKLTAGRVRKTVLKDGGPAAIIDDWNLQPGFGSKFIRRRVDLKIRPAKKTRKARKVAP